MLWAVHDDLPDADAALLDVVVVDDELPSRDLLMVRARTAGYRPRAFATAFAALRDFDERVPDILISDVNMPGMDGLDLVRQVRANGWTSRPYIIITSASGERGVSDAALAAGADAFVPKSASIAGFAAQLQRASEAIAAPE
jgi:CheY-like chemotaxis protein